MNIVIYLIIGVCSVLAVFFSVSFLIQSLKNKEKTKKKSTKNVNSPDKQQQNTTAKEIVFCDEEGVRVSPAVFNREEIMREFKEKNKVTHKEESYEEFHSTIKKDYPKNNVDEKKENSVVDEINSINSNLKAVLFADIINRKL